MQVTARADYAVRAMLTIAAGTGPISRAEVATAQGMPAKFLEGILLQLRQEGLLRASRGTTGGYSPARDPATITVADIVRAVDGPLAAVRGLPPEDAEYAAPAELVRDVWVALRAAMRQVLEATTLADLLRGDLPAPVAALLAPAEAWARR